MVATITRQAPELLARGFSLDLFNEAKSRGVSVPELLERLEDRKGSYDDTTAFERVLAAEFGSDELDAPLEPLTWEDCTRTPQRRAMMAAFLEETWRQATGLHRPTRRMSAMVARGAEGAEDDGQVRAILLSGDVPVNSLLRPYTDDPTLRTNPYVPPIPLARVVARTTPMRGADFRSIYIVDSLGTDAYRMKRVGEGAEIPATTLVSGERYNRIYKHGRAIRATYEQLRRMPLDRIAFLVNRIAVQAEADKVSDALGVMVSGDGNANTAAIVYALTALDASAVAGTLTRRAWTVFKLRFAQGYLPDSILAQEASMTQLLELPILTSGNMPYFAPDGQTAGLGTLRPMAGSTGRLADGLEYGVTGDAPALKLTVFDSGRAIEQFQEIGGDVSEVERFINNQTTLMTITEVNGFGVLDPNATRVLNINA